MAATRGTANGEGSSTRERLLVTKLRPPTVRPDHVVRSELRQRIDQALARPLVLVSAPAGFGKSSMLANWAASQAEWSVGWVSLDGADDDPVRFFTYLCTSVSDLIGHIPPEAAFALIPDTPPETSYLADLINAVTNSAVRLVTVLDDFHMLTNDAAHRAMVWLLDHLPSNWRIVISTRQDPPYPLSSMRATGTLGELRAEDLAFSELDARDLLQLAYGVELKPAEVRSLINRTEGWPAALCLAALSLRSAPDRSRFVEAFAGDNRHVVDYLASEVLSSLSEDETTFLLATALLDEMNADLCDAVAGTTDSASMLRRLEERNLFLISLDNRGEWFRYHHLFADWLRFQAVEQLGEDARAQRCRLAAGWFRDAGQLPRAVEYSLRAGDYDQAAAGVLELTFDYYNTGRRQTLVDWIERLPDEVLARWPAIGVAMAWAATAAGRIRGVDQYLSAAEAGIETIEDAEQKLALTTELLLGRGLLHMMQGDSVRALEAAEQAIDLGANPAAGMGMHQADWDSTWGLLAWGAGEINTAVSILEEIIEDPAGPENTAGVLALGVMSMIEWLDANDRRAVDLANRALELGERVFAGIGFSTLPALATLTALAGGAEAEEAWTQLSRLVASIEAPMPPTFGRLARANGLVREGRGDEAASHLDYVEDALGEFPAPGIQRRYIDLVRNSLARASDPSSTTLTERELAVLGALAQGLSRRNVGEELGLSLNTVKTYAGSAYQKLGAASRDEAVEAAKQLGLI